MLRRCWNSAFALQAFDFVITTTQLIGVVNSVSSPNVNLTKISTQADLLLNCEPKHKIFNGTVTGLETALIPDWDENDDFDNWIPSIQSQRALLSYISGFDNNSRPIWVLEVGRMDFKKLFQNNEKDRLDVVKYVRYLAWLGLKSHSLKSTKEHPVTEHVKIVDLEGFKAESIINRKMNFIGEIFVNLFRVWQGQTRRYAGVVEVYGTSKYEWGPKLARSFPVDQLPEWYGGNKGFKPFYVIG